MKEICITLGGAVLRCHLRYDETADYFGAFLCPLDPAAPLAEVTDLDWAFWARNGAKPGPYLEYSSLTGSCSDQLLSMDRCAFHAVALAYRDRAWLIAAGSGVGKTTQLRTLQALCPGEISVICGDRPILELRSDGGVFVHPSPWNGKEAIGGAPGAPLAGIICLRRGASDLVETIPPRDAAIPVYQGIIQTGETEEGIRRGAAFAEALIDRVPVWRMVNRDVPGSTKLLMERVLQGV